MIFKKKKVIFIHIPKTGGESIKLSMSNYIDEVKFYEKSINFLLNKLINKNKSKKKVYLPRHLFLDRHSQLKDYENFLGSRISEYFIFSFVRNPYDRVVSNFFFIKQKKGHPKHQQYKDWSFNEYIENVIANASEVDTQCKYLQNNKGEINLDFLGKIENFESDIMKLSEILKTNLSINNINKSERDEFIKYYTNDNIQIINEKFKKDFVKLGYKTL